VIPKVRKGGYVPFFLMTRKRSKTALISLVQEAFINGVSRRKRERLARSLGIESLSASLASEITRELEERVKEFRTRPLKAEYAFVWRDALYEKVRFEGKVVSVAIMIAYGVGVELMRAILIDLATWWEVGWSWRGRLPDTCKWVGALLG